MVGAVRGNLNSRFRDRVDAGADACVRLVCELINTRPAALGFVAGYFGVATSQTFDNYMYKAYPYKGALLARYLSKWEVHGNNKHRMLHQWWVGSVKGLSLTVDLDIY